MPTIKSPLTNKTIAASPMREFSIPDASQEQNFQSNEELDLDAMNAYLKANNRPPISNYAPPPQPVYQRSPQEITQLEAQITQAKQAKLTGKERLSSAAKQRIDMLLGTSKMTREVDIDGNVYILQTLKGKEQREVWMSAAIFENTVEFPFELRKQTLARSLVQVAGTDLEMFLGDDSLERKLAFVDDNDEAVLNKLFAEYTTLSEEAKNKYSIKTEEEAKGVAADLKK